MVTVRQSPDRVFAALGDPRQRAGRSAAAIAAEVDEPIGQGSRFRLQVQLKKNTMWADGEVVAFDPPAVVSYLVLGPGLLTMRTTYEVGGAANGSTVTAELATEAPIYLRPAARLLLRRHLAEILGRLEHDVG